ncbi:hypothetical protein H4R18_005441 [Coemansia javaensis]|uniref:Mitochondrial carrier n=1 Tax=Coemansia javaensis TaxID=2761396 RepID=A0A9W8LFJ4_9FUNG|nr:hypothetical protein H4R18_005441 [Coemansia javaensis]
MAGDSDRADSNSGAGGGWKDFVAGSIAGAAQVVRMQIEGSGVFRGPMDCLVKTVRNEGVLGLYKGMASPLVGIAAVNSLLFWAYSYGKALQTGSATATPTLGQVAIAGAGAGAVNSVLASPVELLKVRLQVQYSAAGGAVFRGPVSLARHLVGQFGARGIAWGFWATVAREIPAYAAFYTGFEAAKRALARALAGGDVDRLGPLPLMAAGSAGGVSYWLACYPLDVIKSRVQNSAAPPRGAGYIAAAARSIAAEQGLRGFYRGFTPSVLRSIPAAAVTFASYELVMRALNG